MALAATGNEWDTGGRAAHIDEEADKADDGLEFAELEDAAAGDEHLVVKPIRRNGPDDPDAIPAVMTLLGSFPADHLDEIALGNEAPQSIFRNDIRCFF
jgi:hypothetical protein